MAGARSRKGPCFRTDVSVPTTAIPAFLDDALTTLAAHLPEGGR